MRQDWPKLGAPGSQSTTVDNITTCSRPIKDYQHDQHRASDIHERSSEGLLMIRDILVNLLSDLLFLLAAITVAWAIFTLTRRRQLLQFFGIQRSRRMVIYLSNLRIQEYGSIGIDGRPRSYQGPAAAYDEMEVANSFRNLFSYFLPSLSDLPDFLSKLLIADIKVEVVLSPQKPEELERSASFITLGSPVFNVASGSVERELHSQAYFEEVEEQDFTQTVPGTMPPPLQDTQIASASGTARDLPYQQGEEYPHFPPPQRSTYSQIRIRDLDPITDPTWGFIERVIDYDRQRHVFYAAGRSALATAGAAYFLATEWANLLKQKQDKPFLIMLRFDREDYRRWTIMYER